METIIEGCQECASCCWRTTVFASESEVELIARVTEKKPEEFSSLVDDDLFQFKHKEPGYCIFLEEKEKFYCSIYEHRPETCRKFPSHEEELELCPKT